MSNLLPYAFARDFGVLARTVDGGDRAGRGVGVGRHRAGRHRRSVAPFRPHRAAPHGARRPGSGDRHRLRRRRRRRLAGGRRIRRRPRPDQAAAGRAGHRRPARIVRRRAGDPHDQRAADAVAARRRLRHPHRAVRADLGGALPHRRRAARRGPSAQGDPRLADLAHQDHVAARHRRKAPAAGRPHHLAGRRQAGRRARLDPADRPRRARRAASARQGSRPPRPVAPGHERRRCCRSSTT